MASLNHSRYLLPKSPGWTRYVAGISYWCSNYGRVISAPLLISPLFFGSGPSRDNNWDRFTYNRNPNGFCKSEEDMQKLLASDLQYSVLGAIFANE